MLDPQQRLDALDGATEKACDLDDLWVVSTKLSGHRKVRNEAEHI